MDGDLIYTAVVVKEGQCARSFQWQWEERQNEYFYQSSSDECGRVEQTGIERGSDGGIRDTTTRQMDAKVLKGVDQYTTPTNGLKLDKGLM